MTISQAFVVKIFAIVTLILALGACQTKAPPPVAASEIIQFSQKTQHQALDTMTSLKNCMSLGGELGKQAKISYQNWYLEYGKLVKASERHIANMQNDWVEWQGAIFSLHSIKDYHDTLTTTRSRQNLSNRSPDARHDICSNVYSSAQNYTPYVSNERTIDALYQTVNINNDDLSSMFLLSDLLPHFPAPGKSFYQVTQSLQPGCPQPPEIIPLANEWPNETYASYCGNSGVALIECEWGKCNKQLPIKKHN